MLEIAVLGLLGESPMHGYELRKRLSTLLGTFRAFSYGSLYPTLRRLAEAGWISEETPDGRQRAAGRGAASGSTSSPPRARNNSPNCSPTSAPTPTTTRVSEPDSRSSRRPGPTSGCRSSRAAGGGSRSGGTASAARSPGPERLDRYTLQLQEHGLESADREVRWLNELIDRERHRYQAPDRNTDTQ